MKLTYYPGCSLHSTGCEYDASARFVCKQLGIELVELEDWNCCGASPGHSTNHFLGIALPLRNLILAEKYENAVMAPCAACYNLLKSADYLVRSQDAAARQVNTELEPIMGTKYQATLTVCHPLEILSSPEWLQAIGRQVVRPLTGLKVAAYYGCLLSRPKAVVAFDNPEQPTRMDTLLSALGAEVRRWSYKTDCCGGALSLSQTKAVETLVAKLVAEARRAGAEAIVTACPLCQVNLDTRQTTAGGSMPVFYFTELMGISFGAANAEEWLQKHIIDPRPVLAAQRKGSGIR